MTYLQFHLLFNLPLLGLLGAAARVWEWTAGEWTAAGLVLLAVMVFTSPWDNWAAGKGIWGFPRERYTVKIGHLPLEEYLFFVLQSANVMLGMSAFLRLVPSLRTGLALPMESVRWAGVGLVLGASATGMVIFFRFFPEKYYRYARHLLGWFLPVIALQWAVGAPLFREHLLVLFLAAFMFGTYYTAADLVAVRDGVWHFDEAQITGIKLGRVLPWEEIAFFYLTSLLVAQSFLLFLPASAR
jgi:lycopene cyclase domain-containing protein